MPLTEDAILIEGVARQLVRVCNEDKHDDAREAEGGGSPGEWAYEKCAELETEMKRRGLSVPQC